MWSVSRVWPMRRTPSSAPWPGPAFPVVIRAEADESFDLTHPAQDGTRGQPDPASLPAGPGHCGHHCPRWNNVSQELGIDRRRIHRISNGVNLLPARSPAIKTAARRALAGVNEDLRVPANQPVALCIGQLHPDNAWEVVIRAWKQVAEQWPYARLWLVGDGPQREALYRRIRDCGPGGPSVDARRIRQHRRSADGRRSARRAHHRAEGIRRRARSHGGRSARAGQRGIRAPGAGDRRRDGSRVPWSESRRPWRPPFPDPFIIRCRGMRWPRQRCDACARCAALRDMAASHLQLFQHLVSSSVRTVP